MSTELSKQTLELIEKKSWEYSQFDQAVSVYQDAAKEVLTDPEIISFIKGDGWGEQPQLPIGEEVYRWVNSSERIPDGYGKHYFCIVQNKINAQTFKSVVYKADKQFDVDRSVFEVIKWLEQTQPLSTVEEKKYPIGGYAPGDYWCHCCHCKQTFMGDKRAVQCEPCAEKMIAEFTPSIKEEKVSTGLDQLIEWMEWESHRRWNESHELPDFTGILTKANEIKASLK